MTASIDPKALQTMLRQGHGHRNPHHMDVLDNLVRPIATSIVATGDPRDIEMTLRGVAIGLAVGGIKLDHANGCEACSRIAQSISVDAGQFLRALAEGFTRAADDFAFATALESVSDLHRLGIAFDGVSVDLLQELGVDPYEGIEAADPDDLDDELLRDIEALDSALGHEE